MEEPKGESAGRRRWFKTTRWSLVVAAGRTASPDHDEALSQLCETYWYPVYAYIRRHGRSADDARDWTQGFFADLLTRKGLKRARQERGKFRTFLLTLVKNYVLNEQERAAALKRGGDRPILSLDFLEAEGRYVGESDDATPETLFVRRWTRALLGEVLERLRDEARHGKHPDRTERLLGFLTSDEEPGSYREVAGELGMSEGAVKVAVHRLRKRYAEVLREEVARTLDDGGSVDDEIRQLFAALQS